MKAHSKEDLMFNISLTEAQFVHGGTVAIRLRGKQGADFVKTIKIAKLIGIMST